MRLTTREAQQIAHATVADLALRPHVHHAELHGASSLQTHLAPAPRRAASMRTALERVDRDRHLEAEVLLIGDLRLRGQEHVAHGHGA